MDHCLSILIAFAFQCWEVGNDPNFYKLDGRSYNSASKKVTCFILAYEKYISLISCVFYTFFFFKAY